MERLARRRPSDPTPPVSVTVRGYMLAGGWVRTRGAGLELTPLGRSELDAEFFARTASRLKAKARKCGPFVFDPFD